MLFRSCAEKSESFSSCGSALNASRRRASSRACLRASRREGVTKGGRALVSGRIASARDGTGTVSPGAGLRAVRGAPPPSTIWANSRITVADKRYFTLILSKIPKIFHTFADKSAKTPGSRSCALPAAFSARQR